MWGGSLDQTSSGGYGAIEENRGAVSCDLEGVLGLQEVELVDGDEVRLVDQVGGADLSGRDARWETVRDPDFFES